MMEPVGVYARDRLFLFATALAESYLPVTSLITPGIRPETGRLKRINESDRL
jgi:hypothetical protein